MAGGVRDHRIPQSIFAKSLTWLRARAANEADPYFTNFVLAFHRAITKEIGVVDYGTVKNDIGMVIR
jgi:hypothetical protein